MKSILALLKALLALAFWVLVVIPGLALVLTAVAVTGWRALVWVVDLLPFEVFIGDVSAEWLATLLAAGLALAAVSRIAVALLWKR